VNLYLVLFAAIALEVLGTMLLPASHNFTKPLPSIVLLVAYGVSFYLLAVLSQRLPLAVIYASWSGFGVLSVALLSVIFYKQNLNWQMTLGIFFIIVGVTLVNIYQVES
jgi:small multidrug resistance pump|tara:strand:+ start:626 stop:952 length:327 start_codon:yes stop_codon:yes gene_type:complete